MISNKTRNKILASTGTVLLGAMLISANITPKTAVAGEVKVKNVIYIIADGMSDGVLTASRYYKDAQDGTLGNDKLAMDSIRSGYVKTSWANGPITDSAPAGTALSSGYKTNPGYVGVSTDNIPYATILEAAELKGLSTGLIATSEIMHATPAAFSSHDKVRSNYNSIMKQQVYQDMEVVLGGGDKFFQAEAGGKREDGRDLTEELKSLGYDYVTTKDAMNSSDSDKLWGMFAASDLAYDFDREEFNAEQPSLSEMTTKAIEVLDKNEDGFFLMVEGSKIDWAAHANDPAGTIGDIIAFDDAVQVAVDYAKKNQDTIVVVTTDHANSGFSIGNADTNPGYDNLTFGDSVMQLKGYSLSAQKFNQLVEGKSDADIAELITKYYGYTGITDEEIALVKDGKVNEVLAKRAKIGYTTGGHTGGDVYLGVYTPAGVQKLRGTVDNTDLPKYVASNLGLDLESATNKLFNDGKGVADALGLSYEINTEDKENPYAVMVKDDVTVKLHANTDRVEVQLGNRDSEFYKLPGVIVYNGSSIYTATEDVSEIVATALKTNTTIKADEAAAQKVIDLINKIPAIVKLENKSIVKEARKAYDALTNAQKALVSNYDKLTAAEATIAKLEKEANNKPSGSKPNLPQTGQAFGATMLTILGLGSIGAGGFALRRKKKQK